MIPIAVVGVGSLFPGSDGNAGLWRDILAGRDLVRDVPATHWLKEDYFAEQPGSADRVYCARGAFLSPVAFSPVEFAVPPNAVSSVDTSQLLALLVARRVLETTLREGTGSVDRDRVSVILGAASTTELVIEMAGRVQRPIWVKAMREAGLPEGQVQEICDRIAASYAPWTETTFPGMLGNVVAGRIANRLDLGGTNCVLDAACASSLSALDMSVMELALGQSDLVLTGGVETLNDIFMFMAFSKSAALSRSGDARPFSDRADGTVLGEGVGMVALKRLADAERDDDPIYAVIRGVGSSSDGQAKSVYAPRADGQAKALRRAYATAGYSPASVELVEAHGTGTAAGDAAEFEALCDVYREAEASVRQWCALGSIKSQIGHTKAAAGAAGLIKAIFALHHGILPPTIKVEVPNPQLDLPGSPFYINAESRPWIHDTDGPRRAAVSSFGFGGSNFHVTLEEYRGPGRRPARLRAFSELFLLGAEDTRSLASECLRLAAGTTREVGAVANREAALARFVAAARESQTAFRPDAACRLSIVAADPADLAAKLDLAAKRLSADHAAPGPVAAGMQYAAGTANPGRVAVLFPGQGSQYVGMGAGLAMAFEAARAVWDRSVRLDLDEEVRLDQVVFPPPAFTEDERRAQAERLTRTEWAQPAIGAASLAGLAVIQAAGLAADCFAGHSFGELTALCAAGAMEADELLRLARPRGESMLRAADRPGAMTSVHCGIERLEGLLAEAGPGLVIANVNAPEQLVVSGPTEAIERFEGRLSAAGVRFTRLAVSTAFHSPLMRPAAEAFAAHLASADLRSPSATVFRCSDGAPHDTSVAELRQRLARQLEEPVRFTAQVEAMYAAGVRTFVEVGPGGVLTGLVRQTLDGRPHMAVSLDRPGEGVAAFWNALGRLAISGVPLRPGGLWPDGTPESGTEREAGRGGLTIPLSGINHGRPYPPKGGAAALPPPNPGVPSDRPAAIDRNVGPGPVSDGQAARATDEPAVLPAAALPPAELLTAFQELSRQMAEAQSAFERTLAESHGLFLRAAEASLNALASLGSPRPTRSASRQTDPLPPAPAPVSDPAPEVPPFAASTLPPAPAPATDPATAPPETTPPPMAADAPAAADLLRTLLDVVADKTGYPPHMLGLDLDLEGELGIDSIKRVEILAALQERIPGLPAAEPAQLASLRTLGRILAFSETALGRVGPPPPAGPCEPAPPAVSRRYVVEARPAPAAGFALPRLRAGSTLVAVTDDGGGIAPILSARLAAAGVQARVVDHVPSDAPAVVLLDGLRPCAGPEDAERIQQGAFLAARSVAPRMASDGGVFVTVQDTGGDFGLSGRACERAWLGGLAALAKTAAREWPAASVRAIDLDRAGREAAELGDILAEELLAGGPELEVGLRADGCRLTPVLRPAEPDSGEPPLPPGAVIVASGGARGVTASCLLKLAAEVRPRLVLLGRTAPATEPPDLAGVTDEAERLRVLRDAAERAGRQPSPAELARRADAIRAAREVHVNLAALRQVGAEVRHVVCDVRQPAAVSAALQTVRAEWGSIDALVHGAGVIADKLIAEKTPEQFAQVFGTKVNGLHALLAATARDPLRLICLFSSVAARDGNPGQADYAMANAVLDSVAAAESARRGASCRVKSIAWGPWAYGMVNGALARHFERRGVGLLSVDEGCRRFLHELSEPPGRAVEVVVAAASAEDGGERSWTTEVEVSASSHPYLADHRIRGVPVLPAVLVLEWFVRAAVACRTDLSLAAVEDLSILGGVRLEAFETRPARLLVRCRGTAVGDSARLRLELLDVDGRPRYSAVALMGTRERWGIVPAVETEEPAGNPWPWTAETVYDGQLFHGPSLQVIRNLGHVSPSGASAMLDGVRMAGWRDGLWRTDAALLDGGLQLARLWGIWSLGAATLPTRVAAYVPWQDVWPGEPVRCVLRGRSVGQHQTITDLAFRDARGRLVAELRGVEQTRLPASGGPGMPA